MPVVCLDRLNVSDSAWTFKLLPSKYRDQHMACWAVCQYSLDTSILSDKMIKVEEDGFNDILQRFNLHHRLRWLAPCNMSSGIVTEMAEELGLVYTLKRGQCWPLNCSAPVQKLKACTSYVKQLLPHTPFSVIRLRICKHLICSLHWILVCRMLMLFIHYLHDQLQNIQLPSTDEIAKY